MIRRRGEPWQNNPGKDREAGQGHSVPGDRVAGGNGTETCLEASVGPLWALWVEREEM